MTAFSSVSLPDLHLVFPLLSFLCTAARGQFLLVQYSVAGELFCFYKQQLTSCSGSFEKTHLVAFFSEVSCLVVI